MIKIFIGAAGFTLLFTILELISRNTRLKKEYTRKTAHILSGVVIALLPAVMTFSEIFWLAFLFIPVMLVSKRINLFSAIHEVKRHTYGEVYFAVSICLTAVFFPDKALFMYAILVMGLSDGFASLFGQKYGKKKYRLFGATKSYAGSSVFFLTTVIIGLMVVSSIPLWANLILALILTAAEAGLSKGLDNLILPPFSGGLLLLALTLLDV